MLKVYTIGCPACNVLCKKLIAKDIQFCVITDERIFEALGIEVFPMAQVDDNPLMTYGETLSWLKAQEDKNG